MEDISNLLKGAIDLHVHAGPSVMAREVDAAQMMLEAAKAGYQAFVVKDHYCPTAISAKIVQDLLNNSGVKVYGGIALNNSVGGYNASAVDIAHAMGAKFVWMPTVSAKNHIVTHSHGLNFPSCKGLKLNEKPMVLVDESGRLDKGLIEVLDYIKDTDLILGTGHGHAEEIDVLVTESVKIGIKKILVNHPLYIVGANLQQIKKWASMGAYIELNACVFVPESAYGVVPIEKAAEIIQEIGTEKIVIDSDYGQKGNGSPVEGIKRFVSLLMNNFSIRQDAIEMMLKTNPKILLGLS
jgi:hypothetical protein